MNLLRKIEEMREVLEHFGDYNFSNQELAFSMMHAYATMRSKVLTWQEYGSKTFMLSKELVAAFQNTDIPHDLFPTDFPYPFDTFMVESESPLFQTNLKLHDGTTRVGNVFCILYTAAKCLGKETIFMKANGDVSDTPMWDRALTAFFPDLTLADREWVCSQCNTFHDRDENAAKNVLKKAVGVETALQVLRDSQTSLDFSSEAYPDDASNISRAKVL